MSMMNAIIIDDDDLSGKLMEKFVLQTGFINLLRTFTDAVSALSFLSSTKIDLILLDLEMPGMNGIEFMDALKNGEQQIVVVTSHKEFALESYDYNVAGYLVKPVIYSKFFKTVSTVLKNTKRQLENEDDIVFVKKDSQIIQIRKSEILFVEALGDYAVLNTAKEKFVVHSTLKSIVEKLPVQDYIRVHRSFIVRINKIEKIEDSLIFCKDKKIPIGKSYHEEVFRRLKMF